MTNYEKKNRQLKHLQSVLFKKLMIAENKFQNAMENLSDIDSLTVTAIEAKYDALKECVTEAGMYDEYMKVKERTEKIRKHMGIEN